ncbi:MAG: hypothetical protein QF516_14010, partial [Pirellulaceae bacterium]|nr:hypothetical protein [Pirellulaceae bacterium]
LGKVDELSYERDMSYTTAGQLLGHVMLGVEILEKKLRQAEGLSGEPFPESLAYHLKHLILSHHGEYEYGSPKLPMTPEAMALHLIDNLDAKLHQFFQLILQIGSDSAPEGVAEAGRIAGVSPISGRKSNQTVPQEIASS